ncbi:MAG TPA: adenylate/guanylate cyclase domain-containing protein, partial [Propylenella sp.]|nr:adenylate/guanylate cyclase domain-containing protein [Propylenella sp.]
MQLLEWLQAEGRTYRDTVPFIEAFAAELRAAGIDVCRITTGVPVLHPQVYSLSTLWELGKPASERRFRQDGDLFQQFANSPMAVVYAGGSVRCSLESPPQPGEYPILADLRADGITDYVALPVPFSDASWKAVTLATRRVGGFPDEQVEQLRSLVPTLAMILEIQTLRRTMLTLLDTYVGPIAGQRVLDGAIKRGMCEPIHAIIWTCDLRGFTGLAELLPGGEMLDLLNDYFGAMTEAVGQNGGEVLKFIGDAMLAIFPLGEDGAGTAARALQAVGTAESALAALNEERRASRRPEIRFGLALHVGEVLYGNIGGSDRLDFTVIGRAVNTAARLEGLSRELGRDVLLSGDFAALCGGATEPLGSFLLKGLADPQPVFAPV